MFSPPQSKINLDIECNNDPVFVPNVQFRGMTQPFVSRSTSAWMYRIGIEVDVFSAHVQVNHQVSKEALNN